MREAEELLLAIRRGDQEALEDLRAHYPSTKADAAAPTTVTLADAQLILARSYEAPSWDRLAG